MIKETDHVLRVSARSGVRWCRCICVRMPYACERSESEAKCMFDASATLCACGNLSRSPNTNSEIVYCAVHRRCEHTSAFALPFRSRSLSLCLSRHRVGSCWCSTIQFAFECTIGYTHKVFRSEILRAMYVHYTSSVAVRCRAAAAVVCPSHVRIVCLNDSLSHTNVILNATQSS